jgi:hypothetical protein
MMGNGGPLCAMAGVDDIRHSTDRNQTENIPSKYRFDVTLDGNSSIDPQRLSAH